MDFKWLLGEESGQGMVEYGLILALIAVACIAALTALGTNVKTLFTGLGDKFKAVSDAMP